MPAQNRLPKRNQTTRATIAAGKTNRIILAMTTIMMMPMITSSNSRARSPKVPNEGN